MLKQWKKSIVAGAAALGLAGGVVLAGALPVAAQEFSTGPGGATAPTSTVQSLAPGESQWYRFDYDFSDADFAVQDEAMVELTMYVEDALHFEVWTPKNIEEWVNGEEVTPVGAGTIADEDVPTVLNWVGGGDASETFYIVVENESEQTSEYLLTVSGDTISF